MRYALISDIHANRQAWTAVDKDIRNHGADTILCLGDVVGYGPDPVAVLDAVYDRCAATVVGNHDAVVAGTLDRELFNDNARRLIDWTCDQLGDDAAEYFAGLPYKMSDNNLLCVHAEAAAPARFGYIIDVLKAYESFEAVTEQIIFAGHTHVPGVFVQSPAGAVAWQGPGDFKLLPDHRYLINAGSVGDPRDESPRASYCLYDVEAGEVMFRRVSFDYAGYRSAIEKADLKTKPHCLALLEKGVSVTPPQPLRDMAVEEKATPPSPKEASSQQTVDLKTVQQRSQKRKKRKFAGASRKRGAISNTQIGAISNSQLTAVAAAQKAEAPQGVQPPPNKKLSGNTVMWIIVGIIAASIAIGGYIVFNQLPSGQETTATPTIAPTAPPTTHPNDAPGTQSPPSKNVQAATPPPSTPTRPTANTPAQNKILAQMNERMIAEKRIIRDEQNWNFSANNLDGSNASPLRVKGAYALKGSKKQMWLESNGSTIDVPLPEGANADTITVRFWIKLNETNDGPVATIGPARLEFADGNLVLKSGTKTDVIDIPAATFSDWSHITLTKNRPEKGQYESGIRLFINGKKAGDVIDKELGSQPIAPIQFANFSGAIAAIRVTPKQWILPGVSQDFQRNLPSFSKVVDPPPSASEPRQGSTVKELSQDLVWNIAATGLLSSTDKVPLIIEGNSAFPHTEDNPSFVSFYGGSAVLPLEAGTHADRFNLEFWFRPRDLADSTLVLFGARRLTINKGRLALTSGKQTIAFPPLKLTVGKWHSIVLSKVISGNKHEIVVGFRHEKQPMLIRLPMTAGPASLDPLRITQLQGDLGSVRLLKIGHMGVTPLQHENWKSLSKNLEKPAAPAPTRYRWPIEGASPTALLAEASGGPAITNDKAIRVHKDPIRGTVALLSGGKSNQTALLLPRTPTHATGGSVSFWIKPSTGSGTVLQIAGGDELATLGIDSTGTLKLIVGSKTNGETPIQSNEWHYLAVAWNVNSLVVRLNDTAACRLYGIQKTLGQRIVAIGSPRGSTLPCLIDDIRLHPFKTFPKPEPSSNQVIESPGNIPEMNQYKLIYDIDLAKLGPTIKYDVDNTATPPNKFDRIAYLLELENEKGKEFAYASMDAFTKNIKKIGIPVKGSGIEFQTKIANLNVYSNAKGVTTGQSLDGGNIEFWNQNYSGDPKMKFGADQKKIHDYDDTMASSGDYGSMQIHNHAAKQTILAVNGWNKGKKADLGIGNSTGARSTDWTFSGNAGSYKNKRLRIFVRPAR